MLFFFSVRKRGSSTPVLFCDPGMNTPNLNRLLICDLHPSRTVIWGMWLQWRKKQRNNSVCKWLHDCVTVPAPAPNLWYSHWLVLIDETMYHLKPLKICHWKLKFLKNWYELDKCLGDCILRLMCLPFSAVQAWLCVRLLFLSIFLKALTKQSCWIQGNHREENLLKDVLRESYFFSGNTYWPKCMHLEDWDFIASILLLSSTVSIWMCSHWVITKFHLFLGILSGNLFLFPTQPPLTAASQVVH